MKKILACAALLLVLSPLAQAQIAPTAVPRAEQAKLLASADPALARNKRHVFDFWRIVYEGGHVDHPTYQQVCSGATGHAEAVLVTFDPSRVTFEHLLEEFWRHHDPTTLNRQGPDRGTQYRSAVFVRNEAQAAAAIASLEAFQVRFARPIVTEVTPASTFWPAEAYHQRYTQRTGHGGCHVANW